MSDTGKDFRKRLIATFITEVDEHLKVLSDGLLTLEKVPSASIQKATLETIYRETHSMKGAARAVNMSNIESICQSLEGIFADWKAKGNPTSPKSFDPIYDALQTIRLFISDIEQEQSLKYKAQAAELIRRLSRTETGMAENPAQAAEAAPGQGYKLIREQPPRLDSVRIGVAKLKSLLLQAEEMLSFKLAANQHYTNIRNAAGIVEGLKNELDAARRQIKTLRYRAEKPVKGRMRREAAQHLNLPDFLGRTELHIKSIGNSLTSIAGSMKQINRSQGRHIDRLLNDMKHAMLLPFSALLEGFPMLVRDIARKQDKEADLLIEGEAVEIDRRILEEIKDPLIHLVRNCIDHGIETPDIRVANKKPRRGVIAISISHLDSGYVEVKVSDDGKGIDAIKIKEFAVKNEIISQEEADSMNKDAAISLIFQSGVSTSPIITDISGRGLGLAIVREKIEKAGGITTVSTIPNAGTTFRLKLPVTIATFRGVLVKSAGQPFIIPIAQVLKTARVKDEEIKTVENKETVILNGRPLAFARLGTVMGLPFKKVAGRGSGFTTFLLLSAEEKEIAFGVDELGEEQEVTVKGLGRQLIRVRNIAGAVVLGSGKPVPVINVKDLIWSAVKTSAIAPAPSIATEEAGEENKILVVEDAITPRMLLKNILESAGYLVQTAVDGIDAITILKTEEFDLVVSDIEMPRMDGFELTSRIRNDKKLGDMPVVLVTALEKREDRERGIDAGANAYIVKSSFDQSNLLEVIKRLI